MGIECVKTLLLRAQMTALARRIQEVTGDTMEVAVVDQGATGEQPATEAAAGFA